MSKLLTAAALATGLAAGMPCHGAGAAAPLAAGTIVRIQAGSIEGGWHQGRMHLDAQKCWMVQLDRPTRDHYTLLALIVVDELQVAQGALWQALPVKPLLNAQPAACREYAAD